MHIKANSCKYHIYRSFFLFLGNTKPTHPIDGQSIAGLLNDPKNKQKS
ncbi:MAG: hypothetical protein Q8T04_06365 [Bacteroidota bacterium]|nr:hypothetical protein [Bacteroidota bacterium]